MCSVFQQPPGRLNSQHQGLLGVSPPTGCGLVIHSQPAMVLLDPLVPSPLHAGGSVNSLTATLCRTVLGIIAEFSWVPFTYTHILTASELVLSRKVGGRCRKLLHPETSAAVCRQDIRLSLSDHFCDHALQNGCKKGTLLYIVY